MRPLARGLTLLETLLALALAGIAMAMLIAAIRAYQQYTTTKRAAEEVLTVTQEVIHLAGQGDYGGITASVLLAHGRIPSFMRNGGIIQGAWGGSIDVTSTSMGGPPNHMGWIVLRNVPRSLCGGIVTQLEGRYDVIQVGTAPSGFGGTVVKNTRAGMSFDRNAALAACAAQEVRHVGLGFTS